jgi:hypothetical protein
MAVYAEIVLFFTICEIPIITQFVKFELRMQILSLVVALDIKR